MKLSEQSSRLPEGAGCVAVGYGSTGYDAFVEGGFWKEDSGGDATSGKVLGPFIDEEPKPKLYGLVGTKVGGVAGLLGWKTIKAVMGAKSKSDTSKKGGFQWNLGATLVVDVVANKTLYMHLQKGYADHPDIDDLFSVCEEAVRGNAATDGGKDGGGEQKQ